MNGFCSSPGHQDRPARLYACGWRCGGCAPADGMNANRKPAMTTEGQPR